MRRRNKTILVAKLAHRWFGTVTMRSSAAASGHVAVHGTRDGGMRVKCDDLAVFTIQIDEVTADRGKSKIPIHCK
jgi:hypothetical protein